MDELQQLEATRCGPDVRVPEQLVAEYLDQGRPSSEFTAALRQQELAGGRGLQGKISALQNLKRGVEALAEGEGLLQATPSESRGAAAAAAAPKAPKPKRR